MIEIPKSNAIEEQENELAQWFLTILRIEKKYKSYSELRVAVQETGSGICRMRANGTCLRSKWLIMLYERFADKDMPLLNAIQSTIQRHIYFSESKNCVL